MSESLLISLLGTSKLRPLRIIQEKKPTELCLVISNLPGWKTQTNGFAKEIRKKLEGSFNHDEIFEKEVDYTDIHKIFYLIYEIINEYRRRKKNGTVYIDVSGTTAPAICAASIVSETFKDIHLCYLYAKFKPQDIKVIRVEEKKKLEINKQKVLELPNIGHIGKRILDMPEIEPEKKTFFISYRMVEENTKLYQTISNFIKAFGFTVVSASESGRPDLNPAMLVKDKIKECDILFAILTKDVLSVEDNKNAFPSNNVIEEIGEATNKKTIIIVEFGVIVPSNISQQQTYIQFNRDNVGNLFLELIRYMREIDLF